MFEFDSTDRSVGDRNVAAAHETLAEFDIPIDAEDVGGDHGRSLELDGSTGDLHVRSASVGEHTI
jgi:chemotaxis protein CheD